MTKNEALAMLENWHETHYEIVSYLQRRADDEDTMSHFVNENKGTGGMYKLAFELTCEFENTYKGFNWGEDKEYFDTIEEWLDEKEKSFDKNKY